MLFCFIEILCQKQDLKILQVLKNMFQDLYCSFSVQLYLVNELIVLFLAYF